MRKALYTLCQCTWGAAQTIIGAFVLLLNIRKPHKLYHGAVVTEWEYGGSVSLGLFIFLSREKGDKILAHEYGHTVQSLILGPLYLLVIGLPSVLWAGLPMFKKIRKNRQIPYHWLYTERWANHLGERTAKEHK